MMEIMVLQALASYCLGQLEAALETLAQAVAMAEPGGSIRLFVEAGRTMAHQGGPMTDLLERLNQARPGHTFVRQVLDACRAESWSALSSLPSEQPPGSKLTQRETEILPLLAEGLSDKEIAAKLCIATETVKTHLQNIYRKLNTKGRTRAVKAARALSLIPGD